MQRVTCTHLVALLALTACGGKRQPESPVPAADPTSSAFPASPTPDDGGRGSAAGEEAAHTAALLAKPIYFGYDQATLSPAARATLDAKAEVLRGTPGLRLTVNGHADERGSDEYNLALGMRRATVARRYLVQAGVSGVRIDVVSYGEERPAVQGHDEQAYAANRRDEFVAVGASISQK